MLKESILKNWDRSILNNKVRHVPDLHGTDYPAYTFRREVDLSYGVVIPYGGQEEINENFSKAKFLSEWRDMGGDEPVHVLTLKSSDAAFSETFAALCADLVDPGDDGARRQEIEGSPLSWWLKWKELLGNSSTDERAYDVLGELCALLYVAKKGERANWNGPTGASYDIETDNRFIEVKSTISKFKKEITVSNQFQLAAPEKPQNLIFCVFEPAVDTGISIDGILDEFAMIGYDTDCLNKTLASLGFEKGMSSRKRKFLMQEMLMYEVGDSFPRIVPDSFVGGVLPKGISKINYTVDLSGLSSESLFRREDSNK